MQRDLQKTPPHVKRDLYTLEKVFGCNGNRFCLDKLCKSLTYYTQRDLQKPLRYMKRDLYTLERFFGFDIQGVCSLSLYLTVFLSLALSLPSAH